MSNPKSSRDTVPSFLTILTFLLQFFLAKAVQNVSYLQEQLEAFRSHGFSVDLPSTVREDDFHQYFP
jgi:hypothetical protein